MEHDFSTIKIEDAFDGMRPQLHVLEIELGIDAVCGQIGGGRAMGLSGKKSDNDFDVFYLQRGMGKPKRKYKKRVLIEGKYVEVEFNFIDMGDIKEAAECTFDNEKKQYPSIMYRNEKEQGMYAPDTILPRGEREDYYFTKFHWFVMGDNVWLSDKMRVADYEKFYCLERTVDALDYYYTRAYGNWKNYIQDGEIINLRRYLNCIWQVLSCEWILTYGNRPTNRFKELVREQLSDDKLKENILALYYTNCNSYIDKSNLFSMRNPMIDEYISERLECQCKLIHKYDKKETVEALIKKSFQKYQKKIVDLVF